MVFRSLIRVLVRLLALPFELQYRMWGFRYLASGHVVAALIQLCSGGIQSIPLAVKGVLVMDSPDVRAAGGSEFDYGFIANGLIAALAAMHVEGLSTSPPEALFDYLKLSSAVRAPLVVLGMMTRWIHVGWAFPGWLLRALSVVMYSHFQFVHITEKHGRYVGDEVRVPLIVTLCVMMCYASFIHGRLVDWNLI